MFVVQGDFMKNKSIKNTLNPNLFILLMGFVGVAYTMAGTMFTPIFPEMSLYLDANHNLIKLSLSLFILATTIGEATSGPLLDIYGSCKVACIYGALAVIACLICTFTRDFGIFIVAIFFLGFGTSAGVAIVRALAPADFAGKAYTAVITSIVLLYSLAPGLGQAFGGLIANAFPWWAVFFVLTLMCSAAFVILYFYHYELVAPKKNAAGSFREMWNFLRNAEFMKYNFASMGVYSAIYAFTP